MLTDSLTIAISPEDVVRTSRRHVHTPNDPYYSCTDDSQSIDSHAPTGNAFILNGLGSSVDMKGSQAKVIARPEATRKTKQVSILFMILNESHC